MKVRPHKMQCGSAVTRQIVGYVMIMQIFIIC